ncbi:ribonuclease Z [Salinarimonas soli]|uniref:Ribonuclease Z n=1 Tax=Salinarimonas soli TaxID=1638099 RepID=A0A5B2VEH3_9HYPH|nr:ribonuclease Z [Salinarimonas soli]KAA2236998.1 ribonuclease Z [Salinarimonas soli]
MSPLVQPRLINGPYDDPGLILDFRHARRAILFDLGDNHALSARELTRVSHVFVSHAHMDHFGGFDRLLRLSLHRDGPLSLSGPPGFIERVEHRIRSYTWNLLDERSADCVLAVAEFDGTALIRAARFPARRAFAREDATPPDLRPGLVHDEAALFIASAALDHGIPSLAFRLQERMRVNVHRDGLAALGLPVGPWLNVAKAAVREGAADDTPIVIGEASIPLGRIREHALAVGPGQSVAYVVDALGSPANEAAILDLARNADQIFIEAAFLDEDRDIAAARRHLTAGQAGRLARRAGVRRMTPLHHSPRYLDRPDALRLEAEAAFGSEP